MILLKLEMDLYATKKYKLMYTLNKVPDEYGRIIKHFYYEIDLSNYITSTIENEHYKIHKISNGTKEEYTTITIPESKLELEPIKTLPLLYEYATAKNKTKDTFSVELKLDNNFTMTLDFDKDYYIACNKDNKKYDVYRKQPNGIIDMNEKIETYIFTDKGYLFIDYEDFKIIFTFYNSNDRIECDFKYGNYIKDILPLDILLEKAKNIYSISYDTKNILYSMSYGNENTTFSEYCRYEKVESEGTLYIRSLHPLILDLYDVFYIDKDIFKYWAIDKYETSEDGNNDIFIREVYEIKDNESLSQLINIINSEVITNPIL